MKKLLLAFALIAPVFSTPLFAAPHSPDVRVAYEDLRLSTDRGRATLERRISAAIDTVCAVDIATHYAQEKRAAKRCIAAKQAEVAPQRAAVLASQGVAVQVASAGR